MHRLMALPFPKRPDERGFNWFGGVTSAACRVSLTSMALGVALSCSHGDQWLGIAGRQPTLEAAAGEGGGGASGAAGAAGASADDGLVAYWPFDRTFEDTQGLFPGEAVDARGAPASSLGFASGFADAAVDFRGADSLVRVAAAPALTPVNLSLAFWVNSPQVSLEFPEMLVIKGRDCLATYFCAIVPGEAVTCAINDQRGSCGVHGEDDALEVRAPWPADAWTHVVFTVEQEADVPLIRLRLFIDGELRDELEADDTRVVNNPEWPLIFGGHYQEPGGVGVTPYFSHALLDEMRLYDRPLGAAEVRAQYDVAP